VFDEKEGLIREITRIESMNKEVEAEK